MSSNNLTVHSESIIQQEIAQREKQEKVMQATILHNLLHQMVGQIGDLCNQVGHTDGKGGAEKVEGHGGVGATQDPKGTPPVDPATKALAHGEVFLALLLILFDGPNSNYNCLAKNMGDLQKILNELKKFGDDSQQIQDALQAIMNGKGTAADVKTLAAAEQNMQQMLEPAEVAKLHLSPALVKALKTFSDPGTGDLDQLINKATGGKCTNWQDLANNPDPAVIYKVKQYMAGAGGGSAPKPVTTALSDLSNLMSSIETQNQGQVQQLSLLQKNVDSDAQLFSSTVTLMKAMAQTLTNYSGS